MTYIWLIYWPDLRSVLRSDLLKTQITRVPWQKKSDLLLHSTAEMVMILNLRDPSLKVWIPFLRSKFRVESMLDDENASA